MAPSLADRFLMGPLVTTGIRAIAIEQKNPAGEGGNFAAVRWSGF
jgi:hypothetical protein